MWRPIVLASAIAACTDTEALRTIEPGCCVEGVMLSIRHPVFSSHRSSSGSPVGLGPGVAVISSPKL